MSVKSLFFGLLFLVSPTLYAQITLELGAEMDNSMFSESLSKSNGAGTSIFAGRIARGATFRRALLKFDISSLPSEAIIQTVELKLFVFKSARNTKTKHRFDLHRVSKDWGEANSSSIGGGAPAQTNDATWGSNFYNVSNWTNLGGDFVSQSTANDSVSFSESGEFGVWNSSNMVTDVESWKLDSTDNFGWLLIGD